MVHAYLAAAVELPAVQTVAACTAADELSASAAVATVATSEHSMIFRPPRPSRGLGLNGLDPFAQMDPSELALRVAARAASEADCLLYPRGRMVRFLLCLKIKGMMFVFQ